MGSLILTCMLTMCGQAFVPELKFTDQFDRSHDVKEHRGNIVVLIYGDRHSATANKALGEQIHVHFHPQAKGQPPAQARQAPVRPLEGAMEGSRPVDVLAVPVACVGKVPQVVRKLICSQIRNGSPEMPVWLDFADTMKSTFLFRAGVPNVVVLDGQGRYRYTISGVPTPGELTRLLGVIEELRREMLTPR